MPGPQSLLGVGIPGRVHPPLEGIPPVLTSCGGHRSGMLSCLLLRTITVNDIFTARKRSLGQGNVFTPVCYSVHKGGGVSVPACITGHMIGGSLSGEWIRYGNERAVRILLECIFVLL